ncbi:hypothetical protein U7230_14265 [Carboxydochorda subterranea]|uniref:Uncharacterized protein n=1 Tax=Carboxydichorda subterranea TaxID=3109565 RepID=A0ABZ1BX34_9FIRM|nr:hypothetical protein [Limnochorda sp. L945t]WRP17226.1 hypothetical protein U7230_14265 [Limnochorda sp. L945t]
MAAARPPRRQFVLRFAACLALAVGCRAAEAPAQGAPVHLEARHLVESTEPRPGTIWPGPVEEQWRRAQGGSVLHARTALSVEWTGIVDWPAGGAASLEVRGEWSVGPQAEGPGTVPQATATLDRAVASWIVPGGTVRIGRFIPEWGTAFRRRPSNPLEEMGASPFVAELMLAGESPPVTTSVGYAFWEATAVPWMRWSAAGESGDMALALGHRTGQGPWMAASISREIAPGLQGYAEGVLARPYRPIRVVAPAPENGWQAIGPGAYADGVALRWLAGLWYPSPGGWNWVAEYRIEPGGLDDTEAAIFWDAAAGRLPSSSALAAASNSGAALRTLGRLASDGLPLRRRYLDFSLVREDPRATWAPALSGSVDLDDGSWVAIPEVSFQGWTGVEPALRMLFFSGSQRSEFGAGPAAWSVQLVVRTVL